MITFRSLKDVNIDTITDVFNTSFADYAVNIQMTPEQKTFRIHKARVNFAYSVGAFDDDQLVGMMLIAVESWNGFMTAHNAGTGVIPAYRGQRLVKQMYEQLIPVLKAKAGVEKISLEVLQENNIAIKAYKSVGMQIDRELLCFAADFNAMGIPGNIEKISLPDSPNWAEYDTIKAFSFAWDFNNNGALAIPECLKYIELRENNNLLAFCVLNTKNDMIMQAGAIGDRWEEYGASLLEGMAAFCPKVRWINVDESATSLVAFLRQKGFTSLTDQYEMSGMVV